MSNLLDFCCKTCYCITHLLGYLIMPYFEAFLITGCHKSKVHREKDWSFGQHKTHLANLLRPTRLAANVWVWVCACVYVGGCVGVLSCVSYPMWSDFFVPNVFAVCWACGFWRFALFSGLPKVQKICASYVLDYIFSKFLLGFLSFPITFCVLGTGTLIDGFEKHQKCFR